MPKFQLNKLVRDAIISDSEKHGIIVEYIKLGGQEEILALLHKIQEESNELHEEIEKDKLVGELVDIQQAINDLLIKLGVTQEEFLEILTKKKEKKGGFQEGLYVKTMEMDENNPRSDYYKQDPQRYPEVQ